MRCILSNCQFPIVTRLSGYRLNGDQRFHVIQDTGKIPVSIQQLDRIHNFNRSLNNFAKCSRKLSDNSITRLSINQLVKFGISVKFH